MTKSVPVFEKVKRSRLEVKIEDRVGLIIRFCLAHGYCWGHHWKFMTIDQGILIKFFIQMIFKLNELI